MFAKTIVLSDAFLDMPMSARCLYFTLGMLADDDGFVGNPKSIMRQCGATNDDIAILLAKRFLLGFESGVIVIKHWRMNNYLRSDRYIKTNYTEEMESLLVDEKGAYTEKNGLGIPPGIPDCNHLLTQDRLGKDRLGKNIKETLNRNVGVEQCADIDSPPTIQNVKYKIPIKDKRQKFHPVTEEDIQHYQEFYPELNVDMQIRKMVMWCESNPNKIKTKTGVKSFITRWLNDEQNKLARVTEQKKNGVTYFDIE